MSEENRQCGSEPDAKQTTPQPKFTPGPWSMDGDGFDGISAQDCGTDGYVVFATGASGFPDEVCEISEQAFDEEAQANANLIAAAPEMYAALQAVLGDEGLSDLIAGIGEEPPFWKQIQAVLAKAEGRAA